MTPTSLLKHDRVVELSSDEENDCELSAPAKKRTRYLKKQGNVSIGPVVTLFYKRQIQHTEPQTINGQECSSQCVHCKETVIAWRKAKGRGKNPGFDKEFVIIHLKSCTHENGKAAYKKHNDFVSVGSNDVSLLFPSNVNNEFFYQLNCGLCNELVCVAVKKPKSKSDETKLWSAHLSEHCDFIQNTGVVFFSNKLKQKLDDRFTDAKIYKHADSTGDKRPCFYAFRSCVALIHDRDSFLDSFTYWGSTAINKGDPFAERMSLHENKNKFNKSTTDAIPIAFASKEDVQKLEAVAYWMFKGRQGFRNTAPIVSPVVSMSASEFNVIALSLSVLLNRFYIDYSSKITPEQQKTQLDQAKSKIFTKVRDDYSKVLNENEKQLFNSNNEVLLSPALMNVLNSNKELMRKFQKLFSEACEKIGTMK